MKEGGGGGVLGFSGFYDILYVENFTSVDFFFYSREIISPESPPLFCPVPYLFR